MKDRLEYIAEQDASAYFNSCLEEGITPEDPYLIERFLADKHYEKYGLSPSPEARRASIDNKKGEFDYEGFLDKATRMGLNPDRIFDDTTEKARLLREYGLKRVTIKRGKSVSLSNINRIDDKRVGAVFKDRYDRASKNK